MSTFNGRVAEFPDIRIDYFCPSPTDKKPALAYFLSHVHSDHLQGLETCKSPFIYCSPGTRDVLLRLEKYPHRMNFAKGILEQRKQTYRHLNKLLKAVALETPTIVELTPGNEIRVTLLDANHCVGAVMFLIEGHGKAVLYTGDVRSEPWWVNDLTRQPTILPYVASVNPLKTLDCIYLDTTFVVTGREDVHAEFPAKAEGLQELLQKVSQYPDDTLFYLDAWTFGYEDVWSAVSGCLRSPIHVCDYRWSMYGALANGIDPKAPEAPKLMGYRFGNRWQEGCLSPHSDKCRIHSCEQGAGCDIWKKDFVRITPIVTRHNGRDYVEAGAGGGQGDLDLQHELEVDDIAVVTQLMTLCVSKLSGQPQLLESVIKLLSSVVSTGVQTIKLDCCSLFEQDEAEDLSIEKLIPALSKMVTKAKLDQQRSNSSEEIKPSTHRPDGLPRQIRFPYSRHSSYNELCHLIEAFKPRDIYPCTVDEAKWNPTFSMSALFGYVYDETIPFKHDLTMLKKKGMRPSAIDQASRPDSRPALKQESRKSSSSEYETADSHYSLKYPTDSFANQAAGAATPSVPENSGGCVDAIAPSRRYRRQRQAQGNFRPKVHTDHYEPSSRERKRGRSSTLTPPTDKMPTNDRRKSGSEGDAEHSEKAKSRHRHRTVWQELPPEWRSEDAKASNKRSRRRSPEYDRHSPHVACDGREIRDSDAWSDKTTETLKVRESSIPSMLSSPARSRLAFRREVHSAVRGEGDRNWADIGLISTGGHQKKETEL